MGFKSFFSFSLSIYNLIGLDLNEDKNATAISHQIVSFLKKCFFWFVLILFLLTNVLMGIFSAQNFKNVDLSTPPIANIIVLSITTTKCIVTWCNRLKIKELLSEMESEFQSTVKDSKAAKLIKKRFRSFNWFQKIFATIMISHDIIFALDPLNQLIANGSIGYELPQSFWLPFEISNFPRYITIYCLIQFIDFSSSAFTLSNDIILNAFIVVLSLEFDLFANDLEKLKYDFGMDEIKKLVDRHNRLFQISSKLESIYSISIFSLFIGSSLMLSFPAFQVVSTDESFTVLKYTIFFVTALLQVLLTCYYGDKLKASSTRVAQKCMNCDWYNCDDDDKKKALAMILMRAQKPVRLTALGFFDISIATFSKVRIMISFDD